MLGGKQTAGRPTEWILSTSSGASCSLLRLWPARNEHGEVYNLWWEMFYYSSNASKASFLAIPDPIQNLLSGRVMCYDTLLNGFLGGITTFNNVLVKSCTLVTWNFVTRTYKTSFHTISSRSHYYDHVPYTYMLEIHLNSLHSYWFHYTCNYCRSRSAGFHSGISDIQVDY